jgi:oligoribonuclease NrnB/cAMP/cGMP phosphodiesterase (DHH superfamily)
VPDPHTHLPALPDDLPSLDPADRPLVITHGGGCPDGWCCRWLFAKHFGDGADYLSAKHGDPVPDVRGRPHVYCADFAWKGAAMADVAKACGGRLTVLDHHASEESSLSDLKSHGVLGRFGAVPTVVFDLMHSGAHLTWKFLKDAGATHPVFSHWSEPPLLVRLVEARDLWRFDSVPNARQLTAAINAYPQTEAAWDTLHSRLRDPNGYANLIAEGSALLRKQDQAVEAACRNAVEIVLAGHRVLCVNATGYISEVGERLAAGRPFSATYFDDLQRGLRVWSLRSLEGGEDVSVIAKRLGGGGHAPAAGFQRPIGESMSAIA